MSRYVFCESIHAGGASPWHIRRLGHAGVKLGGGIDTPGLCGRPEVGRGWDLSVGLTEHHLGHSCPRCVTLYRDAKERP